MTDTVRSAAEALDELGHRVHRTSPEWLAHRDWTSVSAQLSTAEMQPYLEQLVAGSTVELHQVTRAVLAAEVAEASVLQHAERAVATLRADAERWFDSCDALLLPVTPFPAPEVTVPFGADDAGMPIGVQLVARRGADVSLLDLAEQLEAVSPVRHRRPSGAGGAESRR
ncbi:hypothetical protein [Pseudonocardia sp. HH130629-09]|uniref:hypothetical protein n=1 Tax=Pseudonocardia sp. HH130629-09 TaxID=1641402 RepID=UPI000A46BE21|nr:hypothetical protein [Pseudonocardia sp. HH130629-09]